MKTYLNNEELTLCAEDSNQLSKCESLLWDQTKDRIAPHDLHYHWHINWLREYMDHQISCPKIPYQSHHGVVLENLAAYIHIREIK